MSLDYEKLARAMVAYNRIGCPEWPYPCPFRSCERLERCLAVYPLQPEERDDKSALKCTQGADQRLRAADKRV